MTSEKSPTSLSCPLVRAFSTFSAGHPARMAAFIVFFNSLFVSGFGSLFANTTIFFPQNALSFCFFFSNLAFLSATLAAFLPHRTVGGDRDLLPVPETAAVSSTSDTALLPSRKGRGEKGNKLSSLTLLREDEGPPLLLLLRGRRKAAASLSRVRRQPAAETSMCRKTLMTTSLSQVGRLLYEHCRDLRWRLVFLSSSFQMVPWHRERRYVRKGSQRSEETRRPADQRNI
mmetsp:Transcript_17950/g.36467  ORF Transcript_17950/g.36467 Transcript_17950/m.36467 type:complete len:230 (-) Transcript_17950:98-787(-)